MLHTEMNPLMAAAAATAAAANGAACFDQQQLSLFKRQNSFEDEVESIYLSSSDLKKQDQLQLLQDAAASKTSATTNLMGLTGLIKSAGQDPYDSMEFAVAKPEDVTGQTLAYKVEDPEEDAAEDVSNLLEANFDFSQLMDDPVDDINLKGNIDAKTNSHDHQGDATEVEGQKFIDEMKEFLGRFETPAAPAAASAVAATANNSFQVQQSVATAAVSHGMDDSGEAALPESLAEELLSMEQRITLNNMPAATSEFPLMDETDLTQAEEMLDLLLADVNGRDEQVQQLEKHQQTDILQEAMLSQNLHDSGFFDQDEEEVAMETEANNSAVVIPEVAAASPSVPTYNVSNVTQFQTADGKQVIIVIQPTPAAPAATTGNLTSFTGSLVKHAANAAPPRAVAADESYLTADNDSSDSDWTPDEAVAARKTNASATSKKRPGRKPEVRASKPVTQDGRVAKRSYKAITDRKKRKKMQNVEAARRYRDKKKQEQSEMETEEQILLAKNKDLKEQLADIENEFKTMKKLMIELGLVRFVK